MEDYYSILGCERNSSFEEIKKRYQDLALKYHPDKVDKDRLKVDQIDFHTINEVWQTLRDPESRRQYDQELIRSELAEQPPIFASVHLKEMDKDDLVYSYACRCGGRYSIQDTELTHKECLVACDECSFNIIVTS